MAELNFRERAIIRCRHLHYEGARLEELGVSKERVRQPERRALVKLRQLIRSRAAHTSDFFTVVA